MKGNTVLTKVVSVFALISMSHYLPLHAQPPQPDIDDSALLRRAPISTQGIPTNQVIIKYRDKLFAAEAKAAETAQMARLSAQAGIQLTYFRPMSGDAHVLQLPQRLPVAEVERIAASLSTLPEVEYAHPDYIRRPMLEPNDPLYKEQWHYYGIYGINLPQAWDVTLGSVNTVVAVIDTGHRPHADLAGRFIGGYDFISNVLVANDGNGRDPNPQDPGDWITPAESASGFFQGCPVEDSSWHGTHVAGTIGALTQNGQGGAGVNWWAKMLSIRVLGKCGGYDSDIIDGLRWAAGLPVPGVPSNPNPAKVLNLSLGGPGPCPVSWQTAINQVNAAGGIIVVAAGNSNSNAANFTPAGCGNVITVGATTRYGLRAAFSNFGNVVDVSAPGVWVLSTSNTGPTHPVADTYLEYSGTSMAAPHVAGVVSLMAALRPSLSFVEAETILKTTAKPFGFGHTCTGATSCGAGIVNAFNAVKRVIPAQWVNITLYESFESGSYPPPGWTVQSYGQPGYQWGRRNCASFHGSHSAWVVGGGAIGSTLPCGSNYPNYLTTYLIYGPFDLSDATAAQLIFRYNINTEPGYDFLFWGSSIDGVSFRGFRISGHSGGWQGTVHSLNDRVGQSRVWIALAFDADFSITRPYGALVDFVTVRKCVGVGTCPGALSEQETKAGQNTIDIMIGVPMQRPPKP